MVSWGVLSAATMLVRGEWSFYALRLALGLAEAGFFPGMILYLTYWFPPRERAAACARFMTAIALSQVVGGPMSGAILDGLNGRGGLAGWQWLFLLEGRPAAAPRAAPAEASHDRHTLREALGDGRVWLLAGVYFAFGMTMHGMTLWVPPILKEVAGGSAFQVGLLTAVPAEGPPVACQRGRRRPASGRGRRCGRSRGATRTSRRRGPTWRPRRR